MRGCVKNAREAQCCTRDEGGPFEAGLQELVSNSRKLLPFKDGGGERYGKGVRKSRHVRVRETNASEPLMRPRNRSTEVMIYRVQGDVSAMDAKGALHPTVIRLKY